MGISVRYHKDVSHVKEVVSSESICERANNSVVAVGAQGLVVKCDLYLIRHVKY